MDYNFPISTPYVVIMVNGEDIRFFFLWWGGGILPHIIISFGIVCNALSLMVVGKRRAKRFYGG